jgi:hypothetical protein
MGAVLAKGIDGLKTAIVKAIIPLCKLSLYILLVCLAFSILSNLAGIIGLIIFMVVFYYYVKGIIFIQPNPGGVNQHSIQNNISNAIFGNNTSGGYNTSGSY